MNTANFFKRIVTFLMCATLCLCMAAPAIATESVAIGKTNYYYVYEDNSETYVGGFGKVGNYKARTDIYNYDKENALSNILMLTAVYSKDWVLEQVIPTAPAAAIVNGNKVTLESQIFNLATEDKKVRTFLWKTLDGVTPIIGTAAVAPTNVTVNADTITNSTVDVTWDASETEAVTEYKVYRNGAYVGSTNTTSFKDVGIEHNTEVSYTVAAVDVTGTEGAQSTSTTPVTTDDIARLWLGAATVKNGAADGTLITDDNFTALLEANGGAYNIDVTDVFSDEDNYDASGTTAIYARSGATAFGKGNALGLAALDFSNFSSRVLGKLSDTYMNTLSQEGEVKVVMNYFDNRVIGTKESLGTTKATDGSTDKNPSIIFKYASDQAKSDLVGTSGFQQTNTNKWKTKVLTLPTTALTRTGYTSGSSALYGDVFKDRALKFQNVASNGYKFVNTNAAPALFAIGSNNNTNASYFHNVVIQKIDIVAGDYVPYGAVYDVDKQGDTQFIELYKPGSRNTGAITAQTDANEVTKNAMAIYGDETATNKLFLGIDSGYISSADNDLIIRVTYLDNYTDNRDADRLTIVYQGTSGNVVKTISRRNTNTWKTAEFFVDDAAFVNGLDHGASIQFGSYASQENAWQVSRIEIIKR